jgi:D-3-phosphoglycerate dehydrogenase
MKILVTCPPMLLAIDGLKELFEEKNIQLVTPDVVQTITEANLKELLPTVDGWIMGDDSATEAVFAAGKAGKLKDAVNWGVGVDNIDFKGAEKLGISVSNTPKMFGNEVADTAVAYLLGLARHIYLIDSEIRKGNWIKPAGMSLSRKTVALGLGDIGLSVVDVFENELLQVASPLRQFEQCIFRTHNGSNTSEAVIRASREAIEIIFRYLNIS